MVTRTHVRRAVGALVFCSLLGGVPVFAQESLLPTVQQVFAQYPDRPLSATQLGAALNQVAAQHPGWGLHLKLTGHRCEQPGGLSVSCDLLVSPSGGVFDVLLDADGAAVPTWHFVGPINTMANFVAPSTAPIPGVIESIPGTTLAAKLDQLILEVQRVQLVQTQTDLKLQQHIEAEEAHWQAAKGKWERATKAVLKVGGKYALPAVAAFWAGVKAR